jgi:hypothetical protein
MELTLIDDLTLGTDIGALEIRPQLALFLGQSIRDSRHDLDELYGMAEQILSANPNHVEALFMWAFVASVSGSEEGFQSVWSKLANHCSDEVQAVEHMVFAFWHAELYSLVTNWSHMWANLSPTDPRPYEVGANSSKLSSDLESFVTFIEVAREKLPTPIHVPMSALQGNDIIQARARIQNAIDPAERAPVFREGGLTVARQYFVGMEWGGFNPKGRLARTVDDVGEIETPGIHIPAIALEAPYSQDQNHTRGIGFCNTVFGWDASRFVKDYDLLPTLANTSANNIDVSEGEIRVRIRPLSLRAKDFKLTLLCQTLADISDDGTRSISAWVLTGHGVDSRELEDGKWQTVSLWLESDPTFWEIAGDNPETNTPEYRYIEAPLKQALILNETTFALVFTGGTWPDIPEGAMELHFIELGIANCQQ